MALALLNPHVIDNYLQLEIQTGRVVAPSLGLPSLSSKWAVSMSSSNATNLRNLILDLSSPAGPSVNDRIAGEDYSLQYMKVDEIIAAIMWLGRGSLMAKIILIWCAKCILHCASPYRGSLVVGYEMVWCLLCRYVPAFGIRPAPLSLNTIWTGLLTVFISFASPPSRQTRRAVDVPNNPKHCTGLP